MQEYRFSLTRILPTAWKVSKYGVISGPYFPVFGLNTEIYGVNLRVQSEYRKIWARNNSGSGHFSRSVCIHRMVDSVFIWKNILWENKTIFSYILCSAWNLVIITNATSHDLTVITQSRTVEFVSSVSASKGILFIHFYKGLPLQVTFKCWLLKIIHPKWIVFQKLKSSWILSHRGWISSIFNQNDLEYVFNNV